MRELRERLTSDCAEFRRALAFQIRCFVADALNLRARNIHAPDAPAEKFERLVERQFLFPLPLIAEDAITLVLKLQPWIGPEFSLLKPRFSLNEPLPRRLQFEVIRQQSLNEVFHPQAVWSDVVGAFGQV